MKYRALGKSGLRVSCLGLGTGGTFGADVPDEVAGGLLSVAYEHGVTLFDATGARAEKTLGDVLKSKGWRRSSYVVTTRVCWGGPAEAERGPSRKRVVEGLRGSLRRLQLDYVDVVFAARPHGPAPMEELVRAMTDVIERGLALYWGAARWSPPEIMEAFAVARQCNLAAPVCQRGPPPPRERPPPLPRLHRQIAWSLRAEGVTAVLLAPGSAQQLLEGLGALQVLPLLTPPVLQELEALLGAKKEPRA
ncbi:voltage-gated potassium channel subunit beta-3 [Eudromia elegans]